MLALSTLLLLQTLSKIFPQLTNKDLQNKEHRKTHLSLSKKLLKRQEEPHVHPSDRQKPTLKKSSSVTSVESQSPTWDRWCTRTMGLN
jgi:hypothetical protein